MGQTQSEASGSTNLSHLTQNRLSTEDSASSLASTSMKALIAEAATYGSDVNESLDAKAQRALECPCIADLRNGSCGYQFSDAFLCFLKSNALEKGSDCVQPFLSLQHCIKANPNAFSEDISEPDKTKEINVEGRPAEEFRIIPPEWSREPQSSKFKIK